MCCVAVLLYLDYMYVHLMSTFTLRVNCDFIFSFSFSHFFSPLPFLSSPPPPHLLPPLLSPPLLFFPLSLSSTPPHSFCPPSPSSHSICVVLESHSPFHTAQPNSRWALQSCYQLSFIFTSAGKAMLNSHNTTLNCSKYTVQRIDSGHKSLFRLMVHQPIRRTEQLIVLLVLPQQLHQPLSLPRRDFPILGL